MTPNSDIQGSAPLAWETPELVDLGTAADVEKISVGFFMDGPFDGS